MRPSPLTARLTALFIGVSLVAATGCGSSPGKVTGKVTFKGNNLKGGTVTLVPIGGGKAFSSTIQEDGTYTIDEVDRGKYKVCVETHSLKGGGQSSGPPYMAKKANANIKNEPPPGAKLPEGYQMAQPGGADQSKRYVPIPLEYSNPDTTTLSLDVTGGTQQHDIPIP